MTSTSVVLGIATLGTPGATTDWIALWTLPVALQWEKDHEFHRFTSRFSLVSFCFLEEYGRTLFGQKINLQRSTL
jgi:hypothetical protein